MKPKNLIPVIAASGLFAFAATAQETKRTERSVRENPDGSITETTRTTTFTPEVRKKVVTYFKPYAEERYGLPADVSSRIKIEKIPATWRTGTLAPGVVIEEEHRSMLVPAPEKLVSIFPERSETTRYYIAGGNVVVVDDKYRVVESVRIPTIKFETSE